jgi:hypothetical protein
MAAAFVRPCCVAARALAGPYEKRARLPPSRATQDGFHPLNQPPKQGFCEAKWGRRPRRPSRPAAARLSNWRQCKQGPHGVNAIRPITPNAPPLDAQGFIAAHAPCIECRYDLRGLKPDGICPECGAPVPWSISSLLPRTVPVHLLKRLKTGLASLLGGYGYLAASVLLGWFVAATSLSADLGLLFGSGVLIAGLLKAAGSWWVTSFAVSGRDAEPAVTSLVLRVIAFCMLLSSALAFCFAMSPTLQASDAVFSGSLFLYALSFGATGASVSWYLGKYMHRFGRRHPSNASRYSLGLFCICGLLVGLSALIPQHGRSLQGVILLGLMLVGMLCGIISVAGILILLTNAFRFISAELKIAQGWANPQADLNR